MSRDRPAGADSAGEVTPLAAKLAMTLRGALMARVWVAVEPLRSPLKERNELPGLGVAVICTVADVS